MKLACVVDAFTFTRAGNIIFTAWVVNANTAIQLTSCPEKSLTESSTLLGAFKCLLDWIAAFEVCVCELRYRTLSGVSACPIIPALSFTFLITVMGQTFFLNLIKSASLILEAETGMLIVIAECARIRYASRFGGPETGKAIIYSCIGTAVCRNK